MGLVLWYAIGVVVFSLFTRRDWKFVISVIIASLLFICLTWFLEKKFSYELTAILLAVGFIFLSFLPRDIIPCHPATAGGVDVTDHEKIVRVGIIEFCWICGMGVVFGIVWYASKASPLVHLLDLTETSLEFRQRLLDIYQFMLGKIVDIVAFIGCILAACMAILWAGEIWRSVDDKERKQYKVTTEAAKQMAVAFLVSAGSIIIWVALPMYKNMMKVLDSF